ncbi:MAG: hypothetical protein ACFFDB_20290 [Promethearchaeota archaeon]
MKELEDLTTFEKTVLLACGKANDFTLKAHNSEGFIRKKIDKKNRQYVKPALKKLVRKGFIIKRPGSKELSYYLSPIGLKACNLLKKELENSI